MIERNWKPRAELTFLATLENIGMMLMENGMEQNQINLVDQMADLLARKRNSHAIAKIGLIQQSVNPKKDKKHWT